MDILHLEWKHKVDNTFRLVVVVVSMKYQAENRYPALPMHWKEEEKTSCRDLEWYTGFLEPLATASFLSLPVK